MRKELGNLKLGDVMSSLEVAGLTDKKHFIVCRDIKEQLYRGLHGIDLANTDLYYPLIQGLTRVEDTHTKRTKEFLLDQDHSVALVSGYDIKARFALAKRWRELEEEKACPNLDYKQNQQVALPQTYAEALRALADESEARQLALDNLSKAEEKIEEDAPKVEVHDTLMESDTTELVGNVAKVLKIPPRVFYNNLRVQGFLTKDNTPTQKSINSGYMIAKIHYYKDNKGRQHENITALVTMKGVIFFNRKFNHLVELEYA